MKPRFLVIGAGMAGIMSAIKLREAGYDDFVVYEKADRLGGTWRENTYPGVACDVPSHLYSYSFAPNPEWSRMFAPGEEICAYLESVASRYDIHPYIRFNSEVGELRFDGARWHLTTTDGRTDEADFVIAATGVLHHPRYPEIPGLDAFEGPLFHSARWDHSVSIEGQRVAVVGTGSSAVQITSAIVDKAAELHLFQRTAQWIMPLPNSEIPNEDRERFRSDASEMRNLREGLARSFAENFADVVVDADSPRLQVIEELCRTNLEEQVRDPDLREKLRPTYRAACKRLIVSPDFYDAIQRPKARLVADWIERIEPKGVRTVEGRLHEVDVVVLATGFCVDRFLRPMQVVASDGVTLDEAWADRPYAYLSVSVPGFPNLFMLNGPNGPVGNFSLIDVAEMQFDYIMQLVNLVLSGRCRAVAARGEAARRLEEDRVEAAKHTVWVTGCRSWYLDDRGVPAAWPWSIQRFREVMQRPALDDFELVA